MICVVPFSFSVIQCCIDWRSCRWWCSTGYCSGGRPGHHPLSSSQVREKKEGKGEGGKGRGRGRERGRGGRGREGGESTRSHCHHISPLYSGDGLNRSTSPELMTAHCSVMPLCHIPNLLRPLTTTSHLRW